MASGLWEHLKTLEKSIITARAQADVPARPSAAAAAAENTADATKTHKKKQNQHFITHAWNASGLRCRCYPVPWVPVRQGDGLKYKQCGALDPQGQYAAQKNQGGIAHRETLQPKHFPLCLYNSAKIKANKLFLYKHTVNPAFQNWTLAAVSGREYAVCAQVDRPFQTPHCCCDGCSSWQHMGVLQLRTPQTCSAKTKTGFKKRLISTSEHFAT